MRPAGLWSIRDTRAGLTIENTFGSDQVAFCYLNWNGAQKRVNLEQWSKQVKLAPGDALTIRNVYDINVK